MIRTITAGFAVALLLPADASLADFATGSAAYQAGAYRAAYDAWYDAALSDDPGAQQGLGQLFESGSGVSQSKVSAYVWYQIAPSQQRFDPKVEPWGYAWSCDCSDATVGGDGILSKFTF